MFFVQMKERERERERGEKERFAFCKGIILIILGIFVLLYDERLVLTDLCTSLCPI